MSHRRARARAPRSTIITLRITLQELDDIEKHIAPEGHFLSLSEAVRELAKAGSRIKDFQKEMNDPKKALEFQAKMKELLQTEQVMPWAESLTDTQVEGYLGLLQMQKDMRYTQGKLR